MEDYAESGNENGTNDNKSNHTFHEKEETFMTNGSRNDAESEGNIFEIDIQFGSRLRVINIKSNKKM